jgi:hypothetical protein
MKLSSENKRTNSQAGSHNTFVGIGPWVLALLVGCNLGAMANTVGFWQFEGTPGTAASGANSVLDSSGNGLNGTPINVTSSGGPTYNSDIATVAGALGSKTSMYFDGHDQQVFVPDGSKFQLTSSLTIEAWIKPQPLIPGTGMQGNILFRGDNRVGLDPYWMMVSSSGRLVFGVESATAGVSLDCPIQWNQWMHVAGTLDGATGKMGLYVNGVLVSSTTTSVRPLAQLDPNYLPGVGIGCDQDTQYAEFFHGWLDDVRLSDVALQPSQMMVPEPSSVALVVLGAGALAFSRKRKL